MGNDNTHWRTGTGGDDMLDQVSGALCHAPRPTGRVKSAPLTGEGHALFMGALGAANAQEAMGQNATF
jgi:hypothetical protein